MHKKISSNTGDGCGNAKRLGSGAVVVCSQGSMRVRVCASESDQALLLLRPARALTHSVSRVQCQAKPYSSEASCDERGIADVTVS